MLGEVLIQRRWLALRVLSFSLFGAVSGAAAVSQPPPDSTPLPLPVPTVEVQLVTSRSFTESAVTLAGLFQFRSESIDPSADAVADPGIFRPLCDSSDSDVTVEFVLHGGGCTLALGWYNANGGTPPAANEIYTAIPNTVTTDMGCTVPDMCPLASAPSTFITWSPHVYAGNVCNDPRYTGGDIGFALVGASNQYCTATKYSERAANVVCTICQPNTPWITTLIYRSKLRSDAYYLAFEDLPMSPTDWRAITTSTSAPDGDFNDFVFHLTGVCHGDDECSAGGNGTGGGGGSSNGGSSAGGSSSGGDSNGGSSNGGSDNGGSSNGGDANGGSGLSGGSDTGGNDTSGAAGLGEGGDGTSGSSPGTCVPGREVACTCSNGSEGSQRCLDDGRGFEACTCGDDDDDDTDSSGGCGCRYGTQGEAGFWVVGVLALVALRRRFGRGALR